jgi:SpoVK/Ycf46/Vps4 family AAA+-type ATPase
MDSSTKRRFVYSMHFKPFSAKARKKIWGKLLRRHPLKPYIQGDFLDKITARFQVDLSAMSGFLHKTWDMVQNDLSSSAKDSVAPEDVRLVQDTLLALLTEQERLKKNGAQVPKLQEQQAVELYDPEVLVTDHDPQEIRNVAQRFLSMSDEQKKSFNLRNLNFLFSGEPGTGKTEFAKHLADDLGKEILIKRASDILNPYVGMSERFIKEAFAEAEREEKILVIDEVDTFLSSRGGHVRSWESSQTNEFLTQMEHYNGILICTTNRVTGLDEAAIRRFNRKVHFGPLDLAGKKRLLARLFGPLLWPESDNNRAKKSKNQSSDNDQSPEQNGTANAFDNYRARLNHELEDRHLQSRLDSLTPLTPSDIATVFQRLAFEPEITLTTILDDLEREVAYKNKERKVGF